MYPNGRYYPPEYYRCTRSTIKIRGRWFVNRSLSPELSDLPQNIMKTQQKESVQNSTVSLSEDNSSYTPNVNGDMSSHVGDYLTDDSVKDPDFVTSDHSYENGDISSPVGDYSMDDSVKDPDFVPSYNSSDSETYIDKVQVNTETPMLDLNSVRSATPMDDSSNKEYNTLLPITDIRIISEHNFYPTSIANSQLGAVTDPNKTLLSSSHIQASKYKINGELRKGQKGNNVCIFCEMIVLNFARHIQRNHFTEIEVQKILSLQKNSKERKYLLSTLRKRGNFLISNDIQKPVKQPATSNVLPCTKCLGFYSSKQLWRHRKSCVGAGDRSVKASAQNLLTKSMRIDSKLSGNVLNRMRADEISLVVKKDPLICAFGSRYIQKNRSKHLVHVASQKMRELAKLLIQLRKIEPLITNLFNALKPQYYDYIVDATKIVAKYDCESEFYRTPTYAMNIATSLKQCCDIAIKYALKKKDVYATIPAAEAEADIKTFKQLIESEWNYDVSSQAAGDLNMNKWNKVTLVPLASDLKLLKEHLISKADSAASSLQIDNNDQASYKILLETIFCRVMLLNRRRPGELQRLPLHIYENLAFQNQNYEEFSEAVSQSEKILMMKFKRIVIRGKRGRGVPVLFSMDVQQHIKIIKQYRDKFVSKQNIYLFGNPNTLEPICGYKVLKKYATCSGAKNPNAITATKLRKHLATLTQILSMSDNDVEQLATFMGHTVGIHKGSYRLPDDVYQTAKISKLLMLMEQGAVAEFKGKSLDEIDIDLNDDLLECEESKTYAIDDNNIEPYYAIDDGINEVPQLQKNEVIVTEKVRKRRILVPWTQEQRKTVETFFANHIKKKIAPKKHECLELKKQNTVLLRNKEWVKIKVYIQNKYSKKR